jgi:hypothetical protein
MLTRKALVLARVEDAFGVCSTAPSATAHALQVWDLDVKPEGEDLQRNIYRNQLDPTASTIGMKKMTVTFKSELKGGGVYPAVGSTSQAPRTGALLRACGMVQSGDAETASGDFDGSIDYTTASGSFESCTLIVFRDGLQYTVRGCRGTFDIEVPAGNYGVCNWTFTGRYETPIDSATPACTYETGLPPRPGQVADSFLADSYGPVNVPTFTVDRGNTMTDKMSLTASEGLYGVRISDFEVKGKISPDAVLLATKNWFAAYEDSTTSKLNLILGADTNNKVTITVPQAQITAIANEDDNGELKHGLDFRGTDDGTNGYSLKISFA